MKTLDFINQNIGGKVYITGERDLGMNSELRKFIYNKTEFILVRLTKKGMAYLESEDGKHYIVPPRNVRLIGT